MKCPYCHAQDKDHVLDSRPVKDGAAIKRRRECDACRGRFTTFEEIESCA
jgi:transcriptional repressor NrdR